MSAKVTISFPIYNVEKYIYDSLLSVLNQDYTNLELLIIDDHGNDQSLNIAKELLQKSPINYRIISWGCNKGQGHGRNVSIEEATGKYIFFMDSDDRLTHNAISTLVNSIEKYHADIVAASFYRETVNGITTGHIFPAEVVLNGENCLLDYIYLKNNNFPVFMWNKLYNLSFLKMNNINCVHPYIEDALFTFKVCLFATKCCLISDITYIYNIINQNSTTKLLMSANHIPLKTGQIHAEIAATKYKYILQMKKSVGRERLLIETIGTGIFHLNNINHSNRITCSQRSDMSKLILTQIPRIFPLFSEGLTMEEIFKHYYYYFLSIMPYRIRKVMISIFNSYRYKMAK